VRFALQEDGSVVKLSPADLKTRLISEVNSEIQP
jgi:hypothetical protein